MKRGGKKVGERVLLSVCMETGEFENGRELSDNLDQHSSTSLQDWLMAHVNVGSDHAIDISESSGACALLQSYIQARCLKLATFTLVAVAAYRACCLYVLPTRCSGPLTREVLYCQWRNMHENLVITTHAVQPPLTGGMTATSSPAFKLSF